VAVENYRQVNEVKFVSTKRVHKYIRVRVTRDLRNKKEEVGGCGSKYRAAEGGGRLCEAVKNAAQ
jgi:hypothetical protein